MLNAEELMKQRIFFPNEFFQDEVREGFMIERKMKCAWAAQMEVLKEIDRICKENEIRYFADYGTLLGAVRHKGFIPWDDDIDIAMPRDEYRRFFEIAAKELPDDWIFTNGSEGGWAAYGRIVNGEAYDTRAERMIRFHGCPYVVGVDIFPLDYVPPIKEEEEAWHLLLEYLWALANELKKNRTVPLDNEIEQSLRQAEEWCRVKFDRNQNLESQLMRLLSQIAQLYQRDEAKELETVVCDWGSEHRYKFKCEWYAESIEVPFENIMVPIPVGYKEVLRTQYGEDYMIPKRGTAEHEYPFYKGQDMLLKELGETMNL